LTTSSKCVKVLEFNKSTHTKEYDNMTTKTQLAMDALLANVESKWDLMKDGSDWGTVYTDNARSTAEEKGMTVRAFNGCLSILKREGWYSPVDFNPKDNSLTKAQQKAFGYVKLPAPAPAPRKKAPRKVKANRTSKVVGA
jgi:hypothetical protein